MSLLSGLTELMKAKCLANDHCSIKIAAAASKFQRPKGQPPQLAPWGSFPWAPTAHKPIRPWRGPPSQHVYILLQVGERMTPHKYDLWRYTKISIKQKLLGHLAKKQHPINELSKG